MLIRIETDRFATSLRTRFGRGLLLVALAASSAKADWIITTIAGGQPLRGEAWEQVFSPGSVAAGKNGAFYLTDYNTASVYKIHDGRTERVAGTGISGFTGDNRPATLAELGSALAVSVAESDDVLISDMSNNRVRRMDAETHVIHSIAGNGIKGFSGDGGLATHAELNGVSALTTNHMGEVFLADTGNCVVRKIDKSGRISTVAGTVAGAGTNSNCAFGGDGGQALLAQLSFPSSVALDKAGNLYIADTGNNRVRRVDAATGVITTLAGNGTAGFSGDGSAATAAELNGPVGIALDDSENVFVVDANNGRIRRVDHAAGAIASVAGNGAQGFSGDGGPALSAALAYLSAVAIERNGDLLIADLGNGRIREVHYSDGIITTAAGGGRGGDGLLARAAELGFSDSFVNGVAVDPSGNVLLTDNDNNRIRRINVSTNEIESVAGSPTGALGFTGDGGPATKATMGFPGGIAIDAAGNLFIEDFNSARIRRVDAATKSINTVAGNGGFGFSGDGGPATTATLAGPEGVGVDAAGNIFIPDTGNARIRYVDAATGVISTYAGNGTAGFGGDGGPAASAELNAPFSTASDKDGNLYIADLGNNRIREVLAGSRSIITLAGSGLPSVCAYSGDGGPASQAQLCAPSHVAVDKHGNVFISDSGNNRIRRVDHSTHVIVTIAGNGIKGFSGDGGCAREAMIDNPQGIAVDGHGTVYFADAGSDRLRRIEFEDDRCDEGRRWGFR